MNKNHLTILTHSGPVEFVLILFFGVTAAYVGTRLGACWVILEERWPEFREQVRDPYPSIAEKAVGPWGRSVTNNEDGKEHLITV